MICTSCVICPLDVICATRVGRKRRIEYHCDQREQYHFCGAKISRRAVRGISLFNNYRPTEHRKRSPRANKTFKKVLFAYNFTLTNKSNPKFLNHALSLSLLLRKIQLPPRGSLSGFVQLFIFEFSTWLFRRFFFLWEFAGNRSCRSYRLDTVLIAIGGQRGAAMRYEKLQWSSLPLFHSDQNQTDIQDRDKGGDQ